MPTFRVAQMREQGIDLLIVEVDKSFGTKSPTEQDQVIESLQARARGAGLAGTVVPVWDGGDGRIKSKSPPQWSPFFKKISIDWFVRHINKELRW